MAAKKRHKNLHVIRTPVLRLCFGKAYGIFNTGMLRAFLGFAFIQRSIDLFGWQFSSTYMTERSTEIKGLFDLQIGHQNMDNLQF